MSLTVRTEVREPVAILTVAGDVDVYSAPRLREYLDRSIVARRVHIVVDLEGVTFMDSTGLGVLVDRLKLARLHKGSLRVVCTVRRILRLFDITGLNDVLPRFETVEEAVADAMSHILVSPADKPPEL